jgi:class 3 adenylate cyclase
MILIDGATRSDLRDDAAFESIGPVAIRGKTQPVDVFALRAATSASP